LTVKKALKTKMGPGRIDRGPMVFTLSRIAYQSV